MYIWSVDVAFRSLYFGMLDVDCLTAVQFEAKERSDISLQLISHTLLLVDVLNFFFCSHRTRVMPRINHFVQNSLCSDWWLPVTLSASSGSASEIWVRCFKGQSVSLALRIVAWWSRCQVRNHAVIYIIAFTYSEHTILISEFFESVIFCCISVPVVLYKD